ncbi:hypothetical protein SAMN05444365_11117 [Micromonospora pattaloongensis]|uniref:Excreted virulence factor EspC, type VII ESX diderm n=1 Tax=Micromonospora pattaloongensis TaxID=405436 RepID=A0A1H3SAU7_9ACTN|nr:hypothetical protein [Micromonospora pattaloongensis]SDZ35223.1 hypothetical protein SAMN05444365_11117 [Micromonospora pattaloongensis]
MESLRQYAGRLDDAAATLAGAARAIVDLAPPASAVGCNAPGRLGEVGRALHATAVTAATARGREAEVLAARLADAATGLRAVADGYAETDAAARRRLSGQA